MAESHTGRRQVLLVEDEPAARDVTCRYLQSLGHQVQVAADVREALQAAAAHPPEVLVCDCNLSGRFNGLEVARVIAQAGVAVILVSGHSPDLLREHLAGLKVAAILQKPVSLKKLAEAVSAA